MSQYSKLLAYDKVTTSWQNVTCDTHGNLHVNVSSSGTSNVNVLNSLALESTLSNAATDINTLLSLADSGGGLDVKLFAQNAADSLQTVPLLSNVNGNLHVFDSVVSSALANVDARLQEQLQRTILAYDTGISAPALLYNTSGSLNVHQTNQLDNYPVSNYAALPLNCQITNDPLPCQIKGNYSGAPTNLLCEADGTLLAKISNASLNVNLFDSQGQGIATTEYATDQFALNTKQMLASYDTTLFALGSVNGPMQLGTVVFVDNYKTLCAQIRVPGSSVAVSGNIYLEFSVDNTYWGRSSSDLTTYVFIATSTDDQIYFIRQSALPSKYIRFYADSPLDANDLELKLFLKE